jgi:hypothetical protein
MFQMDNELPNKLIENDKLFIPKFAWHRVIKGNGDLVVSIEEVGMKKIVKNQPWKS